MTSESHFFRLPSELRIRIYELVLTFQHPIKLRQIVPGSENTRLLRVSRKIYREALAVLHDVNTISVTRNDFCKKTGAGMKTPVGGEHIRHLLVSNFGESIACNFLLDRCDVCCDSAHGLLEAIMAMPRVKTVVVDYRTQVATFRRFRETITWHEGALVLPCTAVGMYTLSGRWSRNINFSFQYVPIARIWPELERLSVAFPSECDEAQALARLREVHGDIPDKLWLLVCARKHGNIEDFSRAVADSWIDDGDLMSFDEEARSTRLDALTRALQEFLLRQTALQCRRFLRNMREQQLA